MREHLRIPGMGETTTHYFRDKLAMRMQAREYGVAAPEFVHLLNDEKVARFLQRVPPPWVLKPRYMAGAIGIKKLLGPDDLRQAEAALGDQRSFSLLERFIPGDILHVDSIVHESEVVFALASGYGRPPMEVAQHGDVFTSRVLERESALAEDLLTRNQLALEAMGLVRVYRTPSLSVAVTTDGCTFWRPRREWEAHTPNWWRPQPASTSGRMGEGGDRRWQGALRASAGSRRLRRAAGFAGTPGSPGYFQLRGARDRMAHGAGPSRRVNLPLSRRGAGARVAG